MMLFMTDSPLFRTTTSHPEDLNALGDCSPAKASRQRIVRELKYINAAFDLFHVRDALKCANRLGNALEN